MLCFCRHLRLCQYDRIANIDLAIASVTAPSKKITMNRMKSFDQVKTLNANNTAFMFFFVANLPVQLTYDFKSFVTFVLVVLNSVKSFYLLEMSVNSSL